jgi:hypothetical protein
MKSSFIKGLGMVKHSNSFNISKSMDKLCLDDKNDENKSGLSETILSLRNEERGVLENIDLLETIYKTYCRANFLRNLDIKKDREKKNNYDTSMSDTSKCDRTYSNANLKRISSLKQDDKFTSSKI